MKKIIVAVAGTEGTKYYDVQLGPGTKSRDILAKLGLNGFQLSKVDGGAYGWNDDIFPHVADGQKVYATKADVQAGSGSSAS